MTPPTQVPYLHGQFNRAGGWLPPDPKILIGWVRKLVAEVDEQRRWSGPLGSKDLAPSIQAFDTVVQSSAKLRMLAAAMLDEVPNKEPYLTDPIGNKQIRDYNCLLHAFQCIVTKKAPEWSIHEYDVGLIGFPFNAILDWPMATPSGYAFFLEQQVNEKLKDILNAWRDNVLTKEVSLKVITEEPGGWLSPEALKILEDDANLEGQMLKFAQIFDCDPSKDHWGFQSWDDFFVRAFNTIDSRRPVHEPNDPKWIVSSCESKPFALQTNVKEHDTFWLKGQPYSVAEMIPSKPEYVSKFVGGTVYQAFLSATSYHRWHSPVKGQVCYAEVIDGTYFSEPTITGFSSQDGPDPAAPDQAQGYISHVATRAVYIFKTKDPNIGFVGAVYVGMSDVSTCEINEKFRQSLPQQVEKGDEIGMFHFGGSTHCLLFEKGLKLAWVDGAHPGNATRNVPVRSALAYPCPRAKNVNS
ncbi:Phophatidylserine decarboxylase-domain-containing protein [Xylaria arbuscula]|nr:Phophatidylserine decarboxylase-domain-containing protein [Xylaria arbuscula]